VTRREKEVKMSATMWGLWCESPIPKAQQRTREDRSGWYYGGLAGRGRDGRLERATRKEVEALMVEAGIPRVSEHGWRYSPKAIHLTPTCTTARPRRVRYSEQIVVRFPSSILEELDAYVEDLRARNATLDENSLEWTRSSVVRMLVARGLAGARASR
jgi:hypothetical protein